MDQFLMALNPQNPMGRPWETLEVLVLQTPALPEDRALPTSSRRDVQLGRESIMEGGEGDTTSKIK